MLAGPTYTDVPILPKHCRQLEARCKQFQQAQAQGRAHPTSLASATASKSSIHTNLQSTIKQACNRCGYNHSCKCCPAFQRKCFNCNNIGHFTTLCRKPCSTRDPATTPYRCKESRGRSPRSRRRSPSRSLSRSQIRSPSRGRHTYRSSSWHSSCSPSQDHHRRRSPHTLNSAYNKVAFNKNLAITKENLHTIYTYSPLNTLALMKSHL